jgi:CheY-like chemotaxis protein
MGLIVQVEKIDSITAPGLQALADRYDYAKLDHWLEKEKCTMNNNTPEKATILVVDDTPANLKLLQEMLQSKGYRVLASPDGKTALNAATKSPPDLILLDINMPEMNGFEVCERLKANELLKAIPILFISALTETTDKMKAFSVGGVDYISKPFQFWRQN